MDKELVKSKILEEIKKNSIRAQVRKVSLFGSYLSDSYTRDSDVDVLIEFKPTARIGFFKLSRFQNELKQTLGLEVDLVTPDSLSKYFRSKILSLSESIYEGK